MYRATTAPLPRPEQWKRVNRNSHGQFMRTRMTLIHVSKELLWLVDHVNKQVLRAIVSPAPGKTYRKPKE